MRFLILGNTENPCNHLIKKAALKFGHQIDLAHICDCVMKTDESKTRVLILGRELKQGSYNAALFRDLHPFFISEYLILAEQLNKFKCSISNPSFISKPFIWSKMHQMIILSEHNLPSPKSIHITNESALNQIEKTFSLPIVLKPVHGTHGANIVRCDTIQEIRARVKKEQFGFFIAQQYLDAPHDYRVIVIDGKSIGAVKKIPAKGEFRTNAELGAKFEAFSANKHMIDIAEKAAKALLIPVAGVDMREHNGKIFIMEVNRNPGFMSFENATGINVSEKIVNFLEKISKNHQCNT